MIQSETFLEKIRRKPEKRLSNSDISTLLLYDIKILLEQNNQLLAQSIGEVDSSGQPDAPDKKWWQRIFR